MTRFVEVIFNSSKREISPHLALILCMLFAFGLFGHLIPKGTFNATGDFPPAVSYALNFKLAVADGQWLPRWVVIPREFTFGGGSWDGTTPTADSAAFLYYAFLQSALAFPLLCLGISSVVAVQIVVCFCFGLGAWALYLSARALGANSSAALLTAYAYLASPWLLSNFYHRGGVAEALSQAALPFLVLGCVWVSIGRLRAAILVIAFGIAWLALCHNLFLMLGAGMCGLFGILYSASSLCRFRTSLSLATRPTICIGAGVAIGILLTTWQWAPAILTLHEILFAYNGNLASSHILTMADYSGVFGFPTVFTLPQGTTDFFMTIGWWTVPAAIALLVQRINRCLGLSLFGCFAIFFVLAYYPQWIFDRLPPSALGAVQFSFRMLAFLSVLSVLGIAMALARCSASVALALGILMTASIYPVIHHQMTKQRMPDEAYLRGYEYNDYYANSRKERDLRYWHNGWLRPDNVITFDQEKSQSAFLRVRGIVSPKIGDKARLYIREIDPNENGPEVGEDLPQALVQDSAEIAGQFDVTLKVTKPGSYRLVTSPFNATESIRPGAVSLIKSASSYVFADDVLRPGSGGYRRTFIVPPALAAAKSPDVEGFYDVELPMIYNRFSVPRQNGASVPYESDFNHRILVRLRTLSEPIVVHFELPWQIMALSLLGIIAIFAVAYSGRLQVRSRNGKSLGLRRLDGASG